MVLQSGMAVPVWGTAQPAEKVTGPVQRPKKVSRRRRLRQVDGAPRQAPTRRPVRDEDRRAISKVKPQSLCRTFLWARFGSGRASRIWTSPSLPPRDTTSPASRNEAEEIATANYPNIRMFTGAWKNSYEPQTEISGTWLVVTPENVKEMSAIGYLFARDMQKELKVPFGIITEASAPVRPRPGPAAMRSCQSKIEAADRQLRRQGSRLQDQPTRHHAALKAWQEAVVKAQAAGQRPPRRRPAMATRSETQHTPP